MIPFKSHSECGQDIFAYEMNGRKRNGIFIDAGCCLPTVCNNSFGLEQIGWHGVCLDKDPACELQYLRSRSSEFRCADLSAGKVSNLPISSDYLSVDTDDDTFKTLLNVHGDAVHGIVTIEHDAYRFGNTLRIPIRKHLRELGYILVCANVHTSGSPFEDWFAHPSKIDADKISAAACDGLDWKEIVSKL